MTPLNPRAPRSLRGRSELVNASFTHCDTEALRQQAYAHKKTADTSRLFHSTHLVVFTTPLFSRVRIGIEAGILQHELHQLQFIPNLALIKNAGLVLGDCLHADIEL